MSWQSVSEYKYVYFSWKPISNSSVVEYSDWQQSRVSSEALKDDIRKARDLALANGLDLKQIHGDQDTDFFIKQGVKAGVARRFVCEIVEWVSSLKLGVTPVN